MRDGPRVSLPLRQRTPLFKGDGTGGVSSSFTGCKVDYGVFPPLWHSLLSTLSEGCEGSPWRMSGF